MNKKVKQLLVLGFFISTTINFDTYANEDIHIEQNRQEVRADEVVNIPDYYLRESINVWYFDRDKNTPITKGELENILELKISDSNISDFEGLQYCINLENLSLANIRDTTDMTAISNLTNLKEFSIEDSNINDINTLSNLINLEYVRIEKTTINNIDVLSNLANLKRLELVDSITRDLSILSNLVSLETLHIYNTDMHDISIISNLVNLKDLIINGSNIDDISTLSNLSNLTHLSLSKSNISNIDALSNLKQLRSLNLDDNNISNIDSLSSLVNLTGLGLEGNDLSNLSDLKTLINLSNLDLSDNNITDISPLSNLNTLNELNLSYNNIIDISPLSGVKILHRLNLSNNKISDLSTLTAMPMWLDLSNNKISDITPLSDHSTGGSFHDFIDLKGNYLRLDTKDLEIIKGLNTRGYEVFYEPQNDSNINSSDIVSIPDVNLRKAINKSLDQSDNAQITKQQLESIDYIWAPNSNIESLEGLQYCKKLYEVNLSGNNIKDTSPLLNVPVLDLYLSNNNISKVQIYTGEKGRILDLSNNNITDITQLLEFIGKQNVHHHKIDISKNLLDLNNYYNVNIINKIEKESISNRSFIIYEPQKDISTQIVNIPDKRLRSAIYKELGKHESENITKSELLKLTKLNAHGVYNIEGIQYCTNLTKLDLMESYIKDITQLKYLTNLRDLDLSYNQISDITSLKKLTKLENLDLSKNNIKNIDDLIDLNGIVKGQINLANNLLDLEHTHVMYVINTLKNRGYKVIYEYQQDSTNNNTNGNDNIVKIPDTNLHNAICDALGKGYNSTITIEELKNITELNLNSKNITSLEGLQYCTNLQYLYLNNNKITDLKPISKLYQLIYLDISNNKITNIDLLLNLYQLQILYAKGNNLSLTSQSTINILINRLDIFIYDIIYNGGNNQYDDNYSDINSELNKFHDLKFSHWAYKSIIEFVNKGYISGYSNQTFRPDVSITRAEFVKVFNKYFGLKKSSGIVFNDTKNHWAQKDIDIAVTNGVCSGVGNNKFNPNAPITREEASAMIANFKKAKDTNLDKLNKFNDKNDVSNWAKSSVEGMIERKYMSGYSNNTFKPKGNITRAEAVVTLSRIKSR